MTTPKTPSAMDVARQYRRILSHLQDMEYELLGLLIANPTDPELHKLADRYATLVAKATTAREKMQAAHPVLSHGPGLPHPHPAQRKRFDL